MQIRVLMRQNLLGLQFGIFAVLVAVQFLSAYANITVIGSLALWVVLNIILARYDEFVRRHLIVAAMLALGVVPVFACGQSFELAMFGVDGQAAVCAVEHGRSDRTLTGRYAVCCYSVGGEIYKFRIESDSLSPGDVIPIRFSRRAPRVYTSRP